MFLQIRAALFHFNQHDWFPDKIGESGAASVFDHAEFQCSPDFFQPGVAKRLKKAVEVKLGFALFVASDVFRTPSDEFRKFCPVRHGAQFAREIYQRQSASVHEICG